MTDLDDSNWPLTDERIARSLAEVRANPCPRSAYCPDNVALTQVSLHIIAEKALTDLLCLRAMEARLTEWAAELEADRTGVRISGPSIAAEFRRRMAGR